MLWKCCCSQRYALVNANYEFFTVAIYGVWHQFQTSPLHMKLCNVISVVHIHQWSDSDIPFRDTFTHTSIDTYGHYTCTYTNMYTHARSTHMHTLTCLHVLQHHSLVYNKMVVRMALPEEDGQQTEQLWVQSQLVFSTLWTRPFGIWMGWSSLPDYPMPLARGELNSLL